MPPPAVSRVTGARRKLLLFFLPATPKILDDKTSIAIEITIADSQRAGLAWVMQWNHDNFSLTSIFFSDKSVRSRTDRKVQPTTHNTRTQRGLEPDWRMKRRSGAASRPMASPLTRDFHEAHKKRKRERERNYVRFACTFLQPVHLNEIGVHSVSEAIKRERRNKVQKV